MTRLLLLAIVLVQIVCGADAEAKFSVPFVRQQEKGCGAASVAMISSYWFQRYPDLISAPESPEEIYRDLYLPDASAVRLSDMKRYLLDRGFHAFTLRAAWADLEEHISRRRPLIVRLQKKPKGNAHFAVVVGLGPKHVWLNDPTRREPNRLSRRQFERRWAIAGHWSLLAVPRTAGSR